MKTQFQISLLALTTVLSSVSAGGDMIIDFPGLLRPRASAVAPASSTNLLVFSSALGGQAVEAVTSTGDSTRPFAVGSDTFTDFKTAAQRSCNNQHNACAKVANSGSSSNGGLTVGQCDSQQNSCVSAIEAGPSSNGSNSNNSVASSSTSSTSTTSFSAAPAAQTQQSSSSIAASTSIVSVASTSTTSAFAVQGTLHSSDDNFLFFCG